MKKPLLFLLFICSGSVLSSQVINWVNSVKGPANKTKITVDRSSNLYVYGYTETFNPSDLEGSSINKFSPDGQLLFTRNWKDKFFISSMLNDGKGSFYFCGSFKGNIHHDGISLDSEGAKDGFFGKMDENGTINWTIGFGGMKNDAANDICFNGDSTEIVITGGVDSTVYIYDYAIITTTKAIFLASFNLGGGMTSFKTYAFTPKEYGENMGFEINNNNNNGYYLLASRKGDHWSNEAHPSGSPMEGTYMYQLDESLNIVWSKFIISSACYYGFSCANMSVQGRNAYVPSFCSGKYGGTGKLQKLEQGSGNQTWSITNNDGTYYDTHVSGNNLLYVGNEEANGCPCEDNNPGFARVKILNENNEDKILFNKFGFHFYNVTQAPNGSIYVYGETGGNDPHLEGQAVEPGYFVFSMQGRRTSYGLRAPDDKLVSAYPNPSSGYVEIVNQNIIEEISIVNGNGAIVRQMKPNSKACTIWDLESGYYIVRLKDQGGIRSGKLIVIK